jgi:hypothetical protein
VSPALGLRAAPPGSPLVQAKRAALTLSAQWCSPSVREWDGILGETSDLDVVEQLAARFKAIEGHLASSVIFDRSMTRTGEIVAGSADSARETFLMSGFHGTGRRKVTAGRRRGWSPMGISREPDTPDLASQPTRLAELTQRAIAAARRFAAGPLLLISWIHVDAGHPNWRTRHGHSVPRSVAISP